MHPVTHLLTGWAVAEAAALGRRDRTLVTVAAVIPDLDGLGAIADVLSAGSAGPSHWWTDYHHVLCHNVGFAVLVAGGAALLAVQRVKTTLLVALAFHLHLFADLIGSRGPDGYPWPIPYLLPFSTAWQWTWDGQWALNAWPNVVLTALLSVLTLHLAWRRGHSPVGMLSARADAVLVGALRRRFGEPDPPCT